MVLRNSFFSRDEDERSSEASASALMGSVLLIRWAFFLRRVCLLRKIANRLNSTHGHEQLQKRTIKKDNHSNCKCV